ncbi:PREDICTED: salicylate carboxymethyltransferase-like [Nelumbo nucifera]|uniref:Salicylate carboxymethyltransferase-like n=2 Tax=Nelumbo nucifera TaxID=4432 RepID=A0A1U7ZEN5_NELNU|nr:PREDICTED: salicylate carboxymethyltransferase-like [Nelumbo nucifera]DAD37792.1 TPA_asm: hypothetical protein HUJ06_008433 [Nelumbo nucifera]
MEVAQVLHMNGGIGETSYACNSSLQGKAISMTKLITKEAILHICSTTTTFPKSLGFADLGCSSGPNTLVVVSHFIKVVHQKFCQLGRPTPELNLFLNDLPGNDFNTIFRSLPGFFKKLREGNGDDLGPCFISGVPGSFYGRLFSGQSLHFVHSSYCLHWLSQVPRLPEINKGNIYLTKTSPPSVVKAYLEQFERDFSVFLRSRSEELVPGGCMVLTLRGRRSEEPSSREGGYSWELLGQALNDLVSQGLIEEEKVNTFNMPIYIASPREMKSVIEREGSFDIDRLETSEIKWREEDNLGDNEANKLRDANNLARYLRAVAEPLLADHFGEALMEELFCRLREILVVDGMDKEEAKLVSVTVSLTRRK